MHDYGESDLAASLTDISAVRSVKSLECVLKRLSARYGLQSIAYFGMISADGAKEDPYLAVTYSSEWVEHYKLSGYVDIDPIVQLGMRRLLPFDWSEVGKPNGVLKTFFGEAVEFGLGGNGLTIPVRGRNGKRALFSVTSNLSDREWTKERFFYMRDFQVIALQMHELVLRLEGVKKARSQLSPRELECLQWVSDGKTAWECAIILGLSQHTVRCYLESARHKLNATSNTHAVSIAHRVGLLSGLL